jgi:hypothetical protein
MIRFLQQHKLAGTKISASLDGKILIGEIVWIYGQNSYYLLRFHDKRFLDEYRYEILPKRSVYIQE